MVGPSSWWINVSLLVVRRYKHVHGAVERKRLHFSKTIFDTRRVRKGVVELLPHITKAAGRLPGGCVHNPAPLGAGANHADPFHGKSRQTRDWVLHFQHQLRTDVVVHLLVMTYFEDRSGDTSGAVKTFIALVSAHFIDKIKRVDREIRL